jgi:hypothetical protein
MKQSLLQLLVVLGILLLTIISPPPVYAQQTDQDSSPTAPQKSDSPGVPPQHANEAQMPASGATTTEAPKTFSGTILSESGKILLKDPVTKVVYELDDASKAKQFLGKTVKVTGKLDTNSNKILMKSIEPIS